MQGVPLNKTTRWYQQDGDAYAMHLMDLLLRSSSGPISSPLHQSINQYLLQYKLFQQQIQEQSPHVQHKNEVDGKRAQLQQLAHEIDRLEQQAVGKHEELKVLEGQTAVTKANLRDNIISRYHSAIELLPGKEKPPRLSLEEGKGGIAAFQGAVFEGQKTLRLQLEAISMEKERMWQKKKVCIGRIEGVVEEQNIAVEDGFVGEMELLHARQAAVDLETGQLMAKISGLLEQRQHLKRDSTSKQSALRLATHVQEPEEKAGVGRIEEPKLPTRPHKKLLGRQESSLGRWRWWLSIWLALLVFLAVMR